MNLETCPFTVQGLGEAYAAGATPRQVWGEFRRRLALWNDPALYLWLAEEADLEPLFRRLEEESSKRLPLFGLPFAIKDNIDWAGAPTSAAFPTPLRTPERSATVVEKLIAAGAFPVGKTNLDQFATGLVGTRSPFGTPRNALRADWIPGGSSSGSASAVAAGLVPFALGTDTAGSGRVPAAFQGLVGWKPTRGLVSTRGVVPACRTLDCVSVFASNCRELQSVAVVVAGFDAEDPYSRQVALTKTAVPQRPRIGYPSQPLGGNDPDYDRAWGAAIAQWAGRAELIAFDAGPLLEAAELLYGGPWVVERLHAVHQNAVEAQRLHPITRAVVATAEGRGALEVFDSLYRLEALKRKVDQLWASFDFLLLPTAATLPTIKRVAAEPLAINSLLGRWTNSFNLVDLAGVALPMGPSPEGRPFGVTLVGPAGSDHALLEAGAQWAERRLGEGARGGATVLAVAGAHMRGLPLNHQLVAAGARFLGEAATAPRYRLYAFADGAIEKPGMVRTEGEGASVPLELWDLPEAEWAAFLHKIPHPLGLGKVELDDGTWVTGFLMEAVKAASAVDITAFTGWRAYLARR